MNLSINHIEILWNAFIILALCSHGGKLIIFLKQISHLNTSILQIKPTKDNENDNLIKDLFDIHIREIQIFTLKTVRIVLGVTFFLGMTYFGGLNFINEFAQQHIYKNNFFDLASATYQTSVVALSCFAAITWMHLINYPLSKIANPENSNGNFLSIYTYNIFLFSIINAIIIFPIILISIHNNLWWTWIALILISIRIYTQWIIPEYIKPIFMKKSIAPSTLLNKIEELSSKMKIKLLNVGIIHYDTPSPENRDLLIIGNKNSRVILFNSEIIEKLNNDEITCLAAYETARKIHHYRTIEISNGILVLLLFFLASSYAINSSWFYSVLNIKPIENLPNFGLYITTAALVLFAFIPFVECIKTFVSRRRIFQLDAYTAQFCDPRIILDVAAKLNEQTYEALLYHPVYSKCFNPTPSLEERRLALNLNSTELIL